MVVIVFGFCVFLAVVGLAVSGLGLGADLVQGLAQLLFIAAFAFPAIAEQAFRRSLPDRERQARSLVYGFAVSQIAFLSLAALKAASLLGVTTLMSVIPIVLNAVIVVVLVSVEKGVFGGSNRVTRAFRALAFTYFWSTFLLLDYARIGRSRLSDPFFMTALALLVATIVVRASVIWARPARATRSGLDQNSAR